MRNSEYVNPPGKTNLNSPREEPIIAGKEVNLKKCARQKTPPSSIGLISAGRRCSDGGGFVKSVKGKDKQTGEGPCPKGDRRPGFL